MRVTNPKPRSDRFLDMTSTPTFRRTEKHAPEEGLGGSDYHVTYRGDAIGFVYSTWDITGVHFRTRDVYQRTITDAEGTPRRFETRAAAVTYLMELHGIRVPEDFTYDISKGPRGGGEDRLDRRY